LKSMISDFQDNSEELKAELVNEVGMKKPHSRKLLRHLSSLSQLWVCAQHSMSTGETKEPTTATTSLDADGGEERDELSLLALRLVSHHKRMSLLRRILSFHETRNPKHYINLRSSSKLFHSVLRPPPLWTSFPHSNHATLQSLVNRLEELRGDEESSGNVPSVLFIEEGVHSGDGWYVKVKKPLSMYGAGCGKTMLVGVGLLIQGKKSDGIVEIEDLSIKGGEGCGLYAGGGMNVIMRGCSIEDFQCQGVVASFADISCDDLQVVGCGENGVFANNNATITLSGQGTTIQGNGTKGESHHYGLKADSSSTIHLIHPLTKEEISTNNGGGGNWDEDLFSFHPSFHRIVQVSK